MESFKTPRVRFLVFSDVHMYGDENDVNEEKLRRVLSQSYTHCTGDYKNLDAVFSVGDSTNNGTEFQWKQFKKAIDECLEDNTDFYAVVPKSHDGGTMNTGVIKFYENLFNKKADFHAVINGFHFMGISCSPIKGGTRYKLYQRCRLNRQIRKAVKEDKNKPVFVFTHEHIRNTVYGSSDFDGWGLKYFKGILKKYPQVVSFSGHSHYPLNDPRSIWQGNFTALGTGALNYAEFSVDDQRKVRPENRGTIQQYWLVEIDENNSVKFDGYDAGTDKLLCSYVINNPSDKNNRQFTHSIIENNSVAPEFLNTELSYKTDNEDIIVTSPSATAGENEIVFVYRFKSFDKNNNLLESKWVLSEYWTGNEEISIQCRLKAENVYKIQVISENAFGKESNSIEMKISER